MKKYIVLLAMILLLFVSISKEEKIETYTNNKMINVEITGAINLPGIYQLKEGSTMKELIKCAQGYLAEADINLINESELLKSKAYQIPYKKIRSDDTQLIRYNLNDISYENLILLPHVTKERALSIIVYRKNQLFESVEDLKKIKGIGIKTYEKIEVYFYV